GALAGEHSPRGLGSRRNKRRSFPSGTPPPVCGIGASGAGRAAGPRQHCAPARPGRVAVAQRVSVVIPTFNAGREFRATLEMLRAQETNYAVEFLVVDSGSTDETVPLCREYGVTVMPREGPFNHGRTRNQAIARAR